MMLSSKLIIEVLKSKGYGREHYKDYATAYESISRLPEFKDVNLDLLFENFEQRLELARAVTLNNQDHSRSSQGRRGL